MRNLSEFLGGVHVKSESLLKRSIVNDDYNSEFLDRVVFSSQFWVENIQQYITYASEKKVVINLTDKDCADLLRKYRLWKIKPEIKGRLIVANNTVRMYIKEINDVPVKIQAII